MPILDRDWRYYAGPHLSQGIDNLGQLGSSLLNIFGPGADVKGMLEDSAATTDAVRNRDWGGAVGHAGMAAAAIPMMLLPGSVKGVKEGIRAYHGSPHDFDKFDISKIGTGEGAQAYGHGLYFAEREGVARNYRDTLAPRLANDPRFWKDVNLPEPLVGDDFKRYNALSNKMRQSGNLPADEMAAWRELRARKRTYDDAVAAAKPKGRMYEVNIKADPNDFLDWDKPLKDQTEKVRAAIPSSAPLSPREALIKFLDSDYAKSFPDVSDVRIARRVLSAGDPGEMSDWAARFAKAGSSSHNLFGGTENISELTQGSALVGRFGAEPFKRAGIPGIKYLDQGSRAAGEGSRNYVVFDPELIEIIRKYGLAALLGGGAAGSALLGGDAQASPILER